jgi:hypothetical protein
VGLITRIISFVRTEKGGDKLSELEVNTGSDALSTVPHFSDIGDDSNPLLTDYAITVPLPETGALAVVGYADPINPPKAEKGDKRIIARDQSTGLVTIEVWLKNDGSAIIENAMGSFALEAGGDVVINGARITKSGRIITALGNDVDDHLHTGNLGTPVSAAYTPPMPPT